MPIVRHSCVTSSRRCASAEMLPDGDRHGAVAHVALERRPDIDREQVALAQHARSGNPVHDLVVDRRANRSRKSVIALERRHAARLANPLLRHAVELARRNAGTHGFHQLGQDRRRDLAAAPHQLDLARGFQRDHALVTLRAARRRLRRRSGRRPHSTLARASTSTSLPVLAIVLDERPRLRVVHFEPFRDRLGAIVLALNQLAAVVVVDAGDLRRIRERVVRAAVARIRPARREPLDQRGAISREEHRGVERRAPPREHRVERLRLRDRARETVHHETASGVARARCSIMWMTSVVGNELPALHVAFGLLSELRSARAIARAGCRPSRSA